MASKARVQKRLYYKIGEACKALGIQPYVLRYWETEFPALTPSKSRSGQRVYSEKELAVIRRIKELLYEEGYTIAGAKKKLEGELVAGSLGESVGPDDLDGEVGATGETPPPPTSVLELAAEADVDAEDDEPPASTLDTDATERIQTLLSGIEEALQEAREILTLLGPKSL